MIKPGTIIPLDSEELNIVAVIGYDAGDFAAYQSYDLDELIRTVASVGDKISESFAREFFPELANYFYRI